MAPKPQAKRDMNRVVQQTAAHAVPTLATPAPMQLTPVQRPAEQPVPAPAPPGENTTAPPVVFPDAPLVDQPPAQQPGPEELEKAEQVEQAEAPAPPATPSRAATPRRRRAAVKVRPTSNADCKGDPRKKHTINITHEAAKRLNHLQFVETMRAGREQPLWPHVDAALAVLRPEQCSDEELAEWATRAEVHADLTSDDYQQIGTLMRSSVLTAVRTLRVRLRSVGVTDVDAQAVLTTAVTTYLDALESQNEQPANAEDWIHH